MIIVELDGIKYVVLDYAHKTGKKGEFSFPAFYLNTDGNVVKTALVRANRTNSRPLAPNFVLGGYQDFIRVRDCDEVVYFSDYRRLFAEIARATAYSVSLGKDHECVRSDDGSHVSTECARWCKAEEWDDYHTPREEVEMRAVMAYFEYYAS